MKRLDLFRHTLKDGPNGIVGPKGNELAISQGQAIDLGLLPKLIAQKRSYDKLFHGPQFQNLQTALAFCQGLGYIPAVMPVIYELGCDSLFNEIVTPNFKKAVAGGQTNFTAIIQVHGDQRARLWGEEGRMTLIKMFDAMKDGEVGLGFFYGIPIELAAWACGADRGGGGVGGLMAWMHGAEIIEGWNKLGEMEGLVFVTDEDGLPAVTQKIGVEDATAI